MPGPSVHLHIYIHHTYTRISCIYIYTYIRLLIYTYDSLPHISGHSRIGPAVDVRPRKLFFSLHNFAILREGIEFLAAVGRSTEKHPKKTSGSDSNKLNYYNIKYSFMSQCRLFFFAYFDICALWN